MPKNRTPGASAANTFRADEIHALVEMFAILDRGGDPRVLLRSDAMRSARRKFAVMAARIEQQKVVGLHAIAGGAAR